MNTMPLDDKNHVSPYLPWTPSKVPLTRVLTLEILHRRPQPDFSTFVEFDIASCVRISCLCTARALLRHSFMSSLVHSIRD
jgi:hypothetical protein